MRLRNVPFTATIIGIACALVVIPLFAIPFLASADGPDLALSISPASVMVVAGQSLTFRVAMTNTGTVALDGVGVVNSDVSSCDKSVGALAPGNVISYTCSTAGLWHSFTDVVTATGSTPDSTPVSASATAAVRVIRPQIFQHQYPDPVYVMYGADAIITIAFTNTGDITLTNATVEDALVPDCARSLGTLPPGVGHWYSCVAPNVTAEFVNNSLGKAQPPVGRQVNDGDASTIIPVQPVDGPAILVEQDPARTMVQFGSFAKFYMALINPGNITVTNVLVTNPVVPDCNRSLAQMAPGQIVFYTCTRQKPPASFVSTVSVSAQPLGSSATLNDSDSDSIVMADYILVSGYSVNASTVQPGGVLTYVLEVRNITTATAPNVVMSATLPAGVNFVKVSGGAYSVNLGSPGSAGVYWQGSIAGGQSHALIMTVQVNEFVGDVTSTGIVMTDGQLISEDTATTRIIANHRALLPVVDR